MKIVLVVSAGVCLASATGTLLTARPAWTALCITSGLLTGLFARVLYEQHRTLPNDDTDLAALLGLDDTETS